MAGYSIEAFAKGILDVITQQVEAIAAEEASAAAKRVEERVRGLTGDIAARVFSTFDMRMDQQRLLISVKLPERAA